jgi:hypothetical protein
MVRCESRGRLRNAHARSLSAGAARQCWRGAGLLPRLIVALRHLKNDGDEKVRPPGSLPSGHTAL